MSEDNIIDLANRRRPVCYTIQVTHYWDGSVGVFVEDIEPSERANSSVEIALEAALQAVRKVVA